MRVEGNSIIFENVLREPSINNRDTTVKIDDYEVAFANSNSEGGFFRSIKSVEDLRSLRDEGRVTVRNICRLMKST